MLMLRAQLSTLLGLLVSHVEPSPTPTICSPDEPKCPPGWNIVGNECFMFVGWEESRGVKICKEIGADGIKVFTREHEDNKQIVNGSSRPMFCVVGIYKECYMLDKMRTMEEAGKQMKNEISSLNQRMLFLKRILGNKIAYELHEESEDLVMVSLNNNNNNKSVKEELGEL